MEVVLTETQKSFVKDQVATGGYLDESEVVREALRFFEATMPDDSPELADALLEGVRSEFRPIDGSTLQRIRSGNI